MSRRTREDPGSPAKVPLPAVEPVIQLRNVWVQRRVHHAHYYNLKRTLPNAVTRHYLDPG